MVADADQAGNNFTVSQESMPHTQHPRGSFAGNLAQQPEDAFASTFAQETGGLFAGTLAGEIGGAPVSTLAQQTGGVFDQQIGSTLAQETGGTLFQHPGGTPAASLAQQPGGTPASTVTPETEGPLAGALTQEIGGLPASTLAQQPGDTPAQHVGGILDQQLGANVGNILLNNPHVQGFDAYPPNHGGIDFQFAPRENLGLPPYNTASVLRSSQQLPPPQLLNPDFLLPQVGDVPNNIMANGAFQARSIQPFHHDTGNGGQTCVCTCGYLNNEGQGQVTPSLCQAPAVNQNQGGGRTNGIGNHFSHNGHIGHNNYNKGNGVNGCNPDSRPTGMRAQRNAYLAARGLCIWCQKPNPAPQKMGCPPCLVKRAKLTARWRQNRKQNRRLQEGGSGAQTGGENADTNVAEGGNEDTGSREEVRKGDGVRNGGGEINSVGERNGDGEKNEEGEKNEVKAKQEDKEQAQQLGSLNLEGEEDWFIREMHADFELEGICGTEGGLLLGDPFGKNEKA
ncbi:hypothetical protein VTH82DRAFT_1381 [Thermothelomyces myriococcoides]